MAASSAGRARDIRLDLFRGLTMLIIFVAHVPHNAWNGYIPARFGFSSGTELFVFCSGIASAGAFGGTFLRRGGIEGTRRIVRRIWQVYWSHIGLAVALIALAAGADAAFGTRQMTGEFAPLLSDPAGAIFGLVSLTWLPDYLDILPVYLVILALVPVVVLAARITPMLPLAALAALYGLAWTQGLNLPGNPWEGSGWYLNPFAWQAIFFLGFFWALGWLPRPALGQPVILAVAAFVLALAVPLSFWAVTDLVPALAETREILLPAATEKSLLHPLRIVHFLALAYVTLSLIEPWRQRWLERPDTARLAPPLRALEIIGQQSLATFLTSLVLARVAGIALDLAGRDTLTVALVNLSGCAALLATALAVRWLKTDQSRPATGLATGLATRPALSPRHDALGASASPIAQEARHVS